VRIVAIDGPTVIFEGADMLDGTPLLDIKPYYPKADRPDAPWGGWTEQLDPEEARRIGSRQTESPSASLNGLQPSPEPIP
jgi:tRNA (Thr-GGU) A37 N-methylase